MIKNKLFNVAVISAAMLTSSLSIAQSLPCYGSEILDYTVGTKKNSTTLVDLNRRDSSKALGQPQNDNTENFVSLGYGGSISIGFNGAVLDGPGNDITIIETSYRSNDCNSDGIERANVEVTADGINWISVGQVCRNGAIDIADAGLEYAIAIKIINDESSTTFDGYDVDGVIANAGCVDDPGRQGCYATELVSYVQGTRSNGQPITDPIRIDPTKALGAPQNDRTSGADNFFSLGQNGWIILKMGGDIITDGTSAPDLRVYETTWGNRSCASYPEYAEISVSYDAVIWYSLGVHCQSSNISLDVDAAVPAGLLVSYVKIANTGGATNDFFDVDGVESLFGCQPTVEDPGRDTCYATCILNDNYVQGTQKNGTPLLSNRTDVNNALGAPQYDDTINFVTLGYGGSIDLCFGGRVANGEGNDLQIIETSFGSPACGSYHEYVDASVSIDGITWYPVSTGCLDFAIDISDASVELPYINYLRLTNNNLLTDTEDGYDIDAVIVLTGECQPGRNNAATDIAGTIQANASGVVAWPNPTRDNVNFSFKVMENGPVKLELYNLSNQLVATVYGGQALQGVDNVVKFDGSRLDNGIYISRLTTADGIATGKVIVAH